jgi:hypothetical protein
MLNVDSLKIWFPERREKQISLQKKTDVIGDRPYIVTRCKLQIKVEKVIENIY